MPDSAKTEPAKTPADEFVALFIAHQHRIHRYIVALLSTQQDADDLVQETAAILWRKFAEFDRGTSFFAWSCRTAYLLVLEHRRRTAREAHPLRDEVLEQLAVFATEIDGSLEVRLSALRACLGKLARRDRDLIERAYSANAKVRSMAAELERSAKSVRKSLGRVRRALLQCVRRSISVAEREAGGS